MIPQLPIPSSSSVVTTAIAMPTAAIRLPRLALVGCVPPRMPRMNSEKRDDVEQRGGVATRLEHGDGIGSAPRSAAGLRGESGSEGFAGFLRLNMPSIRSVTMKPPTMLIAPKAIAMKPITYSSAVVGVARDDQAAEHDDAVDRVGLRHQRRVQRRRDLRDDLEADERGEDEDRQLGDEVHQAPQPPRRRTWRARCWISPSWVRQAPATTSSSKSGSARPPRRRSGRGSSRGSWRRAGRRGRPCRWRGWPGR